MPAVEAVKALRAKGFRAMRLEDGVPEWRGQGLPVAGRTGTALNSGRFLSGGLFKM